MRRTMTVEAIANALGGRRIARGWIARCPAHRDRTPSLSIAEGADGRPLLHCFGGCGWRDIRDALRTRGLWPDALERYRPLIPSRSPSRGSEERKRDEHRRVDAARHLWAAGRPFTAHDPTGRYLTSRGLAGPWPPTLRFVAEVRHPKGMIVPALVAAACQWPYRAPTAVQLTALTPKGGKASVSPVRWTRGLLRGAAVRLAPLEKGRPIVVVEGVEDGLSTLHAVPQITPWAVLGAANVKYVALPEGAEVILALDGDQAGRRAASEAVTAFLRRGHAVRIATLPNGTDPASLIEPQPVAECAA